MRTRLLVGTLIIVLSFIMTGCLSGSSKNSGGSGGSGNGGSGSGNGNGNATLQSITMQPQSATVAPGDTKQFTATGHYSDGTHKDVTTLASWHSADTTIATVGLNTGLATAVASGTVEITVSFSGIANSAPLTVAKLSSITVTPANPSINPTDTLQFTATATYGNGEKKDITTKVTWSSSDISIATIDASTGLADGIKPGKTTITATYLGSSGNTQLTVRGIVSISITPVGPAIAPLGTQQFKATAKFNDNSTQDVTNLATWASSDTGVATIDNKGLATATSSTGQTEISATYQTIVGQTAMNVTTATFTNADLNGDYVVSLTGTDSRGTSFVLGTIHADGNGNVSGTIDANTAQGVVSAQTVLGTYKVFPDGRGDMSFAGSVTNGANHALRFVLTGSKSVAQVIEFDTISVSHGKLELESGPFTLGSLNGTYSFAQGGFVPSPNGSLAGIGTFTSDGAGNITAGEEDINNNGTLSNVVFVATTYSQPNSSLDRYLIKLNGENYVLYLVSPSKAYIMSTDASPSPVLGGTAESQTTTSIANGSYVFLTDAGGVQGNFHIAGQLALSVGSISGGEQDEIPVPNLLTVTGGSYTASGGGRYALCETIVSACDRNFILYAVSASRFLMLRSDAGAANVAMGSADLQSATTVANGLYGLRAAELGGSSAGTRADLALLYVPEGTCQICGIGDRDGASTISSLTLSAGAFTTVDSFGRGTFSLNEPGSTTMTYIFYVVSNGKLVVIGENPNSDGVMNLQ